jgi:maltooligosyltrehalose trehalohydrolase
MNSEPGGYWSATFECPAGSRYRFLLEAADRAGLFPDPASRFQPFGPHGPSEVVDPSPFRWTDEGWPGLRLEGQVFYELHVGTFTAEGTFLSAARDLARLRSLGITCVELMPVADFSGRFGWGYDGVDMFAPSRLYGRPDDLRSFVDQAHALGVAVILDVVYNHFGLDGNYALEFSPVYQTDRYPNEWGNAIDFDGPEAGPVREFFLTNAVYWLDEFHFDGFRFDATQVIFDSSPEHILAAVSTSARQTASRPIVLVAENETQYAPALAPPPAGWGVDALWNDDFHHSCRVALSGHNPAYYSGYRGTPQELVSAAKWSFLYQGQYYRWQGRRRGQPTRGIASRRFVQFLDNHDQVANSGRGERCHRLGSPGRLRALTALLLLLPQTPLLFQGQEYGSDRPFFYFADNPSELAAAVREGRHGFLAQFPTLAATDMQALLPDPSDPETFLACKLEEGQVREQGPIWRLHSDLLALRRSDPTIGRQADDGIDGAVLGLSAFAVRFFSSSEDDRLLLVNLGTDLPADPMAEPLLAPPPGSAWTLLWSSERPEYGGEGATIPAEEDAWFLPGEAAVLLQPSAAGAAAAPSAEPGDAPREAQ